MIFYTAVFFVALTLLDRLVIFPIFSRLNALDKEIQEKEAIIKKNLRLLAQKERIIAESNKYSGFLGPLRSEEEEITSLLKEVETLANKSGIYISEMRPAGIKESDTTKRYQLNLSCEGSMEQIAEFMYNIEGSYKLLVIERYQINPKAKESIITRCNITISKIILPK
ncbi:MAG: type 4a pilus biogenesis protein PilO [Candidatus Omnitrophica bacterium]|nr:type 4a pilus biogenesis protein PilO [Candidatus Omnitrophota bacterium]